MPTEIELCNLLNLSEDEYWIFVEKTAAYNGQRPAGYELIPDIRAAEVFTIKLLVQIGIAVAAATVSYLLTPKPKEQKSGGSRRTADAISNSKFAPQSSFNSIQELAEIGNSIPLIFTNQLIEGDNLYGGIRVNSQLLWSQFVSFGRYQQLKALALFSYGTIGTEPDYEGYAVGDTLLNTYNAYKVGLYFRDGSTSGNNRIVEGDRNTKSKLTFDATDPFVVGVPNKAGTHIPKLTSQAFSGARNPTTQTSFGVYAPIPNCQICRLPYELVREPRGAQKSAIRDLMRKRKKVEYAKWPTRAGIIKVGGSTSKGLRSVNEGDVIIYQIVGMESGEGSALQRVYDHDQNTTGYQEDEAGDAFNYRPHGVDDVDNLTTTIRENTDSLLTVGEQYLIGTAVVICISNHNEPAPWTIATTKEYSFKVIESGEVDLPVSGGNLVTHCHNPLWYDPRVDNRDWKNSKGPYSLSDFGPVYWQQKISGTSFVRSNNQSINYGRGSQDLYYGHDIYTAQRIALATVTNNRKCDVTEIGLKSKVFKRIQFSNVNSQPDEEALKRAFDDRTQLQLGQVNTYADRISLFMLQVRQVGDSNWQDLKNTLENHTGLFAVKGNTPEFQYNAITISHPTLEQYEYRFKPYPGNYITRGEKWDKRFNLLATDGSGKAKVSHFHSNTSFGTFDVAFSGNEGYEISQTEACNPEWQLGTVSTSTIGTVTSAKLEGATSWISSSDFNGAVTACKWKPFTVHKDKTIVLWNEVTNPSWAAVHGHQWSLYGFGPERTTDFFPNTNSAWPNVYFWQSTPERKYRPADPTVHYHPNDNNHHFHVEELRWECSDSSLTRYDHFDGYVEVLDGTGSDLKVKLKIQKVNVNEFYANFPALYEYRADWTLDPNNLGTGYKNGDLVRIPWTNHGGAQKYIQVKLLVSTRVINTSLDQNFNPFDAIADWNVYEGDENSNRNNPEHQVVYVNEIIKPPTDNDDEEQPAKYSDLAFSGIRINSSTEWTNFSQFSAYFKKGIKIEKLYNTGMGPHPTKNSSNLFPEIAYALLTDTKLGAGKLVGAASVDKDAMTNAAEYCFKNKFFWDGTISSKLNLRDFIFEHAGYCLLDFTIIGGRFSLKPSVPVNANNEIDKTILPEIKCLFTDGNINDLQVSFLTPEERQSFKAAVLYRDEKTNGFPETKTIIVREKDPHGSDTDVVETFDLSGFCTSKQQALYFAYFALRSRRLVDHGLTFKTAPQYVQGLGPGDYFRLVSEVSHTNRFSNGAKLENGTVVSKDEVSDDQEVLYWEVGTVGVKSSTLSDAPNGVLFTVKNTTTENKVYKCETISYGENGLLEVSGSFVPTESNGQLSVMQHWGLNQDTLSFKVTEDYD